MPTPKVPLRGRIEEHSLPTVLRALLREGRDGCLTVSRAAIIRRLYLRGGMITYGSSNEPIDRLGEILIAQGKLSRADHKRYWSESHAGNRLLGITLVVNGRITLHDLYQGVTAQVVTILDRLQKWRKGDYEFEEGREPSPGSVLLCIPLALYLKPDAVKPAKAPRARKVPAAAPDPGSPPPWIAENRAEQELEVCEGEPPGAPAIDRGTAQELENIGEISFLSQELRNRLGQPAHVVLGVAPDAEHLVVQAAHHRIAKVLHPERMPKGCSPDLEREAVEIYREVTAAAQAMEEGLRRKTAAAPAAVSPRRAGQPPPEEEQARRFFSQGRDWIAKRNYWQAADALRQAVRLKPGDAVYRQYLGLALMQTKRLHEAEEHLVEATRLEPVNPSHFVNLGRIYRGGRLYKKAREAFERALRIDPRDDHAREELRDLPEEAPPPRKGDGGLLKKLFGK